MCHMKQRQDHYTNATSRDLEKNYRTRISNEASNKAT